MTADEAIKEFKERIELGKKEYLKDIPENIEALEMAIEALEEVEQYRALGTVEELKEAKEKQIPKKPKNIKDYLFPETYDYDYSTADCPCCGESFSFDESYQINFCNGCGQAIDWSE